MPAPLTLSLVQLSLVQTATIGRAPALVSNRRAIRNFNLSGLPGRSARSRDVASM